MIHLDTSFLIRAVVAGSLEDKRLRRWLRTGETVRIASLVWAEFLCGPVSSNVAEDVAELFGEPVPFEGMDATVAAQLYNLAGRRRGSMIDCMIAAVALRDEARLATGNAADFRRFAPTGLRLA